MMENKEFEKIEKIDPYTGQLKGKTFAQIETHLRADTKRVKKVSHEDRRKVSQAKRAAARDLRGRQRETNAAGKSVHTPETQKTSYLKPLAFAASVFTNTRNLLLR